MFKKSLNDEIEESLRSYSGNTHNLIARGILYRENWGYLSDQDLHKFAIIYGINPHQEYEDIIYDIIINQYKILKETKNTNYIDNLDELLYDQLTITYIPIVKGENVQIIPQLSSRSKSPPRLKYIKN